jgi:hypothetical protein
MSDTMLLAGNQALALLAPALKDPDQALLPDFQGVYHFSIAFVDFKLTIAQMPNVPTSK